VGSQFWDLDFTQGASHDPGPEIFLAHDFQDMDGEPGDFTMSEGHGHPLVKFHDFVDNSQDQMRGATQAQQAMTLPKTQQLQQNKKRAPIKHKTSLRIKISIFNLYAEIQ
jgi:hypothetical protein